MQAALEPTKQCSRDHSRLAYRYCPQCGEFTRRIKANVKWSDMANATPVADIQLAIQNETPMFGAGMVLKLNDYDLAWLMYNQNPIDFGGAKSRAAVRPIGLPQVASWFCSQGMPRPTSDDEAVRGTATVFAANGSMVAEIQVG